MKIVFSILYAILLIEFILFLAIKIISIIGMAIEDIKYQPHPHPKK